MVKIISALLFLLLSWLGPAEAKDAPPPVDQAFQFSAQVLHEDSILARWKIAPGYKLYRERFKFSADSAVKSMIGKIILPPGIAMEDSIQGRYQAYREQVGITLPILNTVSGKQSIVIEYQGCADAGFCYPPTHKKLQFVVNPDSTISNLNIIEPAEFTTSDTPVTTKSDQSSALSILASRNWPLILISFLGFGLLLGFTPCVFPMIPILSGIIVGHATNLTTRKAFLLSLTYVFAMSLSYAVAGVLTGYAGSSVQASLQNPWVILGVSSLFVILALSLFGLFELKIPGILQNHLSRLSYSQTGGTYWRVTSMGIISSLVVSPCVTAPLVGALTYIAKTGDSLLGGAALFTLGLGMGAPLLFIGTFSGKLLPKAGPWMNAVQHVFGVIMLGVAIWLLSRILPGTVVMWLWAILAIVFGIIFGALKQARTLLAKTGKTIGIIMLLYSGLLVMGATIGSDNPLNPLKTRQNSPFTTVTTLSATQTQLEKANALGKTVLLDFYADWCATCKKMDRAIFSQDEVLSQLKDVMLLRVDLTKNDAHAKEIGKYFTVIAPPTIILVDKIGQKIKERRLVGEITADQFLEVFHEK